MTFLSALPAAGHSCGLLRRRWRVPRASGTAHDADVRFRPHAAQGVVVQVRRWTSKHRDRRL